MMDACGNSSTTNAVINIIDTTPPTGPASIPGTFDNNVCYGNAIASFSFNAVTAVSFYSDNCGGALTATLTNTSLIGDNCLWVLTYTFKVSDPCGNMLTGRTITHTGSDQTAPTGSPPAPSIGNNGCKAGAASNYPFNPVVALAGYSDNCGSQLTATVTNTSVAGANDCSWALVYTFKVMDPCGNTLPGQQMVFTGSDQSAPTFTKPADITIFTNGVCTYDASVAVTGDVTNESDNCMASPNATFTDVTVDGPCECSHLITRTWSLIDACGNAAANQVQTITVYSNIVENLNDSGPGSLRSVIACVPSGSTITFGPALLDKTITLTSGEIMIDKNITLAGLGKTHLSISGNMSSRAFHLLPGYSMEINNMMLKDCVKPVQGGAICVEGTLTFDNIILQHNFENGVPKALSVIPPAIVIIRHNVELMN